mgnify:CR=1 FL=1
MTYLAKNEGTDTMLVAERKEAHAGDQSNNRVRTINTIHHLLNRFEHQVIIAVSRSHLMRPMNFIRCAQFVNKPT